MKYLVFGKTGQLGKEFLKTIDKEAVGVSHLECDISDLSVVLDVVSKEKPDVIINCAAYNLVDQAEKDFSDAYKVNALGVRNLAYASKKYGAFFIHYSTDYVFDGAKEEGLYTEEDNPNPINQYGKSKFTGEKWLKEELERFLLFRVSWVYGEGKQNFIYKLLQWSEKNPYLKVAYDEISVPTSTRTIVNITLKALKKGLEGLYHLTNTGYASRYEWAKEIFRIKNIQKFIKPVSSDIFNLPARRPKFSPMSNKKISSDLSIDIPLWNEELSKFLNK
jgi:dTDP-4-dehydrorhamnose reductase